MKTWPWVVGGIVALGFVIGQCREAKLPKLKQDAVVLDSSAVQHKRTLKEVRQHSDGTFVKAGPTLATDTCKAVVKRERAASDNVTVADSLVVKNLKQQVALLQPPRLKLFAEADYGLPATVALLQGDLNVRAGVMLRVGSTWAYAARQQPIAGAGLAAWHVGVRKEFRLF